MDEKIAPQKRKPSPSPSPDPQESGKKQRCELSPSRGPLDDRTSTGLDHDDSSGEAAASKQSIIHIDFINGQRLSVPMLPTSTVAELRAKIKLHRPTPVGSELKLLHNSVGVDSPATELANSDLLATLAMPNLTAVYSKGFTKSTMAFIRRSLAFDPDTHPCLGLVETHVNSEADAKALVEVLQQLQPKRLILHRVRPWLGHVVAELDQDLVALEVCEFHGLQSRGLPRVASFLRRCPSLRLCRLRGSNFGAQDVLELRQQATAQIVI